MPVQGREKLSEMPGPGVVPPASHARSTGKPMHHVILVLSSTRKAASNMSQISQAGFQRTIDAERCSAYPER
jgi:hypothetical protein